jgi:serine/threonine protein kinase
MPDRALARERHRHGELEMSPRTITSDGACFDEGLVLPATLTAPPGPSAFSTTAQVSGESGRTTVLPRVVFDAGARALSLSVNKATRYREHSRLGTGGLGEVTLATDEDIGRHVAIKRLHENDDESAVMRFVDEVQVMGRLDHPNIVPVHDVGCDPHGRLYFVMKRLEGDTLEAIIERLRKGDVETHRRFPITVRLEIIKSVLHALQFAHAQRTIHRDLKPANVMVGKYGEVSVVDWGIAKRLQDPVSDAIDAMARPAAEGSVSRTREGVILGTPAYMSPEQTRGENATLDERSDIFSACVMFYELLTLHYPFGNKRSVGEVLDAIRKEEPKFMPIRSSWRRGSISVELGNFVHRGLAKDPDDRYTSVGEMIEALHDVVDGTFPVTCPTTLIKSGLSFASRVTDSFPRAVGMAFIVVTLAALAALALAIIHWVR